MDTVFTDAGYMNIVNMSGTGAAGNRLWIKCNHVHIGNNAEQDSNFAAQLFKMNSPNLSGRNYIDAQLWTIIYDSKIATRFDMFTLGSYSYLYFHDTHIQESERVRGMALSQKSWTSSNEMVIYGYAYFDNVTVEWPFTSDGLVAFVRGPSTGNSTHNTFIGRNLLRYLFNDDAPQTAISIFMFGSALTGFTSDDLVIFNGSNQFSWKGPYTTSFNTLNADSEDIVNCTNGFTWYDLTYGSSCIGETTTGITGTPTRHMSLISSVVPITDIANPITQIPRIPVTVFKV